MSDGFNDVKPKSKKKLSDFLLENHNFPIDNLSPADYPFLMESFKTNIEQDTRDFYNCEHVNLWDQLLFLEEYYEFDNQKIANWIKGNIRED